ncbi:MAG TPA: HEAT repeat domain-containing protein [Tepidisphaeraceae bacterium]|jgi:putative membrane-bound dehydrogenase-like protein
MKKSRSTRHRLGRHIVQFAALAALVGLPFGGSVGHAAKTTEKKIADKKPDPKAWQVADGWKLEILAEKPTIHHPSVLYPAPDGRIFLAEDPMDMKGSSKEPADRILVIHPDGKITVFADHLYAVFGMQYIDGKLYVHHTPRLSVFTDKDSVGVDGVDLIESDNPAPNLDGHGFNDHIPSNIRLAMDGYLYMTTGDKGIYNAESTVDHRKGTIHGGGILRIRPDGTGMEVYATGTRNHLDVAINAEDEMFTYDNTDDGLGWWCRFTHMVDGGYYGYPYDYRPPESDRQALAAWEAEGKQAEKVGHKVREPQAYEHPYAPWTLWRMAEYGGGSPTGSVAYNEDALPAEFDGNIFASEWGKGEVERFVVAREGGTYKVVRRDVLLKGGPEPLRPVGIQVLPDGSGILVADWNYNGWRNENTDAGRLLKLTRTGKLNGAPRPAWYMPAAEGEPFQATTVELVAGLSHPAESVRLVAQRRLADRGTEVVAPLVALLKDTSAPNSAKWHAIWTLDRIDGGNEGRAAIIAALKNTANDLTVRMQAARELGTRKAKEAVPALISALDENNKALRFRAATALGRIGDVSAVQPLLDKLDDADLFTHYAIFKALNRIAAANPNAWEPIIQALASRDAKVREGAALAMHETYDESLVRGLAGFATSAGEPPDARAAAIAALAPLQKQWKPWSPTPTDLKWWGTMPARNPAPPKDVEWAGTPIVTDAIRAALNDSDPAVRRAAVQGLKDAPDPTVSGSLAKLFETDQDVPTRESILAALAAAKSPEASRLVDHVLSDAKRNEALVPAALEAAQTAGGPEMAAAVTKFVGTANQPELMVSGLETLAKLPDDQSIPAIIKRMQDANPAIASAAAKALGAIQDDAAANAAAPLLKAPQLEVKRAAAEAMEQIKRKSCVLPLLAAWRDPDVQKQAIAALAARPDIQALDAYLEGLASPDGSLRNKCRKAIEAVHEQALPLIESRLDTNPPPAKAVAELQTIYQRFLPPEKRTGKLYTFDTHSLSPEAFFAFARSHPTGNAANGRRIFSDANGVGCIKCHKMNSAGGDVGPALDGVGGKYPREFLIESILYPSKQILDGYQQTLIKRKSTGDIVNGIVRAETDADVTLVDSSGQKITIKKGDIALRKLSNLSLMPEGLQTSLKPEEFVDVVAYLESLKEAAKK